MAGRVASLFAEIGADTSGLKRGLQDAKAQLKGGAQDMATFGKTAKASFASAATAAFVFTAALGVATRGVKELYALGRAGAFLELTESRFERLTGEVGATAEVLQRKLRVATRGTVSDMMLMATATDILSLKLVTSGNDAVRLANIVGALGADMNQVVLALTNQTTMRFDQIGIAVGGFEDKLKSLEAQGLSTQAAFTEAFLQQGEEQIRRTGHVADDAAGAFLRLEAAWANYTDSVKKGIGEAIFPVIKAYADMFEHVALVKQAMADGVITNDEYQEGVDIVNGRVMVTADLLELVTERYAELDAQILAITESTASWDQALLVSAGIVFEQAEAVFDLKAALSDLQIFVDGPLGRAYEQFGAEQYALIEQAAMLRDQIAYLESLPQTAEGQAELQNLRGEMANVHQAIIDTSEAFDEQTRRMLLDLIIQRVAIAELPEDMRAAAFQMINDLAFAWGLIDQVTYEAVGRIDQAFAQLASGNIQEAKRQLFELGGWANSVAGDYYIRFHVVVNQQTAWENAGEQNVPYGVGAGVDSVIPPGTSGWSPPAFDPPDFGSVGGGGSVSSMPELPPTMAQMAAPFTDTANALSQIGDFFAQRLQDELIDPLQKKIDAIDALLSPQHIDMVARERAAELEAERAKAAQEMAEAQEKILMLQKAQMNLQFLEYQIKLLDLIAEHDLNASDILGGLELGIDADAASVVEAMAKAIQALIAQAEKELGIASPSKVAEYWGRSVIQGLKVGLLAELPTMPALAPSLADSLFMGAGIGGGAGKGRGEKIEIHVHPSEGMDERLLARKVGEVVQEHLYK
jgi:hypothetical protein